MARGKNLYVNSGIVFSYCVATLYEEAELDVCKLVICRDQLNSRFHGRDIFREIGLLP